MEYIYRENEKHTFTNRERVNKSKRQTVENKHICKQR